MEEARQLWRHARRHQLSVRSLLKESRSCSRLELLQARRALTPYHTQGVVARVPGSVDRAAAWCVLPEVLCGLHALQLQGGPIVAQREWWVVISVDGTNVWQAQATRGDVLLYTPAGHPPPPPQQQLGILVYCEREG